MDQLQQGESVEGADGMIGDDDQPARSGDIFPLPVGDHEGEVEIFEDLFDELDAAQVRVAFGKILKSPFMQQAAQQGLDEGAGEFSLIEGRIILGDYLIDGKHGNGPVSRP